jgi:hypothetical protein
MPTPFADHTGKVFGFWTVKSFYGRTKHNQPIWLCVCECGTEKPVIMGSLQNGRSKSCGCKAKELRAPKLFKHGMAGTPTYKSWHQMHQRCSGKHGHDYYLVNGIKVCERWDNFENFYADMGDRPTGTTLDRIDGTRGYEPGNCRWADLETQANNRHTNVKEVVFGEVITPAQAARKYGKHISGIRHRLRKGWTLEQAVSVPYKNKHD